MNETKTSCAPADNRNLTWDGMNWSKCEAYVRKLQARIVKAQKEGRHNKVKALQWMLTHSFYAKALAVKRVGQHPLQGFHLVMSAFLLSLYNTRL